MMDCAADSGISPAAACARASEASKRSIASTKERSPKDWANGWAISEQQLELNYRGIAVCFNSAMKPLNGLKLA